MDSTVASARVGAAVCCELVLAVSARNRSKNVETSRLPMQLRRGALAIGSQKIGRVCPHCAQISFSLPQSWRCRPTPYLRFKVVCRVASKAVCKAVCKADLITAKRVLKKCTSCDILIARAGEPSCRGVAPKEFGIANLTLRRDGRNTGSDETVDTYPAH